MQYGPAECCSAGPFGRAGLRPHPFSVFRIGYHSNEERGRDDALPSSPSWPRFHAVPVLHGLWAGNAAGSLRGIAYRPAVCRGRAGGFGLSLPPLASVQPSKEVITHESRRLPQPASALRPASGHLPHPPGTGRPLSPGPVPRPFSKKAAPSGLVPGALPFLAPSAEGGQASFRFLQAERFGPQGVPASGRNRRSATAAAACGGRPCGPCCRPGSSSAYRQPIASRRPPSRLNARPKVIRSTAAAVTTG